MTQILKRNILTILIIFSSLNLFSEELEKSEKTFSVKDLIFDHIGDSHEWHIVTIGENHISVPLPVILYSENQGFVFFMSNKFHQGHEKYKNFRLELDGENKGKIVEVLENGSISIPMDFSITKNVTSIFISLIFMLFIFIGIANVYKKNPGIAPKGLQSFIEPLIIFVRDDIAKSAIGEKKYITYMPFLLTVFFFIFINNLFGLIPIFPFGANVTGNISVTLTLALITFLITTSVGNKNYWGHIFNPPGVPWWLLPLMIFIEIMGIFIKPFVLMIRLFANATAGHVVVLGFFSLIFIFGNLSVYAGYGVSILSISFTIFMTLLELLVAFIQAYVFTLLSALYFGMATEESH